MLRGKHKKRKETSSTIECNACERPKGNEQMSEPFTEKPGRPEQRNMSNASVYSASIQEAMRYDKLRSADYLLVMSILHAVLHGDTEEQWQEE